MREGIMTFFPEPVKPSEGRQDDHPIVNPIESDKKRGEGGVDWRLPKGEKVVIYGVFLSIIAETLSFYAYYERERSNSFVQDEVLSNLHALKELLCQLQERDQGKTPEFCQNFSNVWKVLSREMCIITRTKRKGYVAYANLQALLTDIEHYPFNEERKLGFYLQKYAGKEWFPMPFREILAQLHIDYCVNQESSILTKWLGCITQILQK